MAYVARPVPAVVARSRHARGLGDLGIQIGPRLKIGGSVGKVLGNVQKAVGKAVTDTGHVAGQVLSNPITQGVGATLLAATGVGLPAAAGILGASKGVGKLIAPGGNLGKAATGLYQGAITGAIAAEAPAIGRGLVKLGKGAVSIAAKGGSAVAHGVTSGVENVAHGIVGGSTPGTTTLPMYPSGGDGEALVRGRRPYDGAIPGRGTARGGTSTSGRIENLISSLLSSAAGVPGPTAPYASSYPYGASYPTSTVAPQTSSMASALTSPVALAAGAGLILVLVLSANHTDRRRRAA